MVSISRVPRLPAGCCLLAAVCWLLAAGCRLLAAAGLGVLLFLLFLLLLAVPAPPVACLLLPAAAAEVNEKSMETTENHTEIDRNEGNP